MSLNLPPELISCVAANIESQPTLYNLAQCSRQLYRCTIPHLYRHVIVHAGTEFMKLQLHSQLEKFASLIIRRPDLARLVRSFTLHLLPKSSDGGSSEGESTEGESTEGESSEGESFEEFNRKVRVRYVKVDSVIQTAVEALSLSKEEKNYMLGRLGMGCTDVNLALLLLALLNVEKLVLDWQVLYYTYRLLKISMGRAARSLEKPFDLQPAFEALTVFEYSELSQVPDMAFIALLLKLPALRVISGSLGPEWEDKNLRELNNSSSPLTCLNLVLSAVRMANLCHILRAPKALKKFSYKVSLYEDRTFTEIRHALEPQESSLERLCFDHDKKYYDFDEEDQYAYGMAVDNSPFFGPMASFISFNALKVFKTEALFLHATDNGTERDCLINIFPPNLETLHLTRFSPSFGTVLESVEHLLAQKSSQQIPSLKTLILEETEGSQTKLTDKLWGDTQETVIGRLSRVAAAQGVSLDVVISQQ